MKSRDVVQAEAINLISSFNTVHCSRHFSIFVISSHAMLKKWCEFHSWSESKSLHVTYIKLGEMG